MVVIVVVINGGDRGGDCGGDHVGDCGGDRGGDPDLVFTDV